MPVRAPDAAATWIRAGARVGRMVSWGHDHTSTRTGGVHYDDHDPRDHTPPPAPARTRIGRGSGDGRRNAWPSHRVVAHRARRRCPRPRRVHSLDRRPNAARPGGPRCPRPARRRYPRAPRAPSCAVRHGRTRNAGASMPSAPGPSRGADGMDAAAARGITRRVGRPPGGRRATSPSRARCASASPRSRPETRSGCASAGAADLPRRRPRAAPAPVAPLSVLFLRRVRRRCRLLLRRVRHPPGCGQRRYQRYRPPLPIERQRPHPRERSP